MGAPDLLPRSLVLNATFEPLSVVSGLRALVLLLEEKAECIVSSGRLVTSERAAFDAPSVVRLARYVHVPFRERANPTRRGVLVRDGGACQYCAAPAESIDHVTPRSRGGTHTWDNVVAACRRCNARKRDRLLSETQMRLRVRPTHPGPMVVMRASIGSLPSAWEPFFGESNRVAS